MRVSAEVMAVFQKPSFVLLESFCVDRQLLLAGRVSAGQVDCHRCVCLVPFSASQYITGSFGDSFFSIESP